MSLKEFHYTKGGLCEEIDEVEIDETIDTGNDNLETHI